VVEFVTASALKTAHALQRKVRFPRAVESVVVGDDDLGPIHIVEHVARNEFAAGVVAIGIVGWEDAQPGLCRQAWGAKPENHGWKCLLAGRRVALIVCHAIIIAITVVLPSTVASFSATRNNSGLASRFADTKWSSSRFPFFELGATSVSQIAVSTASTWPKEWADAG